MPRLHHVNLSIPVGGEEAEAAFLLDVLEYRRVERTPDTPAAAKWFESDDGTQIHLSEDPAHHPSARAHVALELGERLADVEHGFDEVGHPYDVLELSTGRTLFCHDPAGNRWELRGTLTA